MLHDAIWFILAGLGLYRIFEWLLEFRGFGPSPELLAIVPAVLGLVCLFLWERES